MSKFNEVVQMLDTKKVYSRNEMITLLQTSLPALNNGSYQWALGSLLKSGQVNRIGYNEYALPGEKSLPTYSPAYSDLAEEVMKKAEARFPGIQFTVFETVLMNEFLNHLIAQNTVFLQAEKEIGVFIFRYFQEEANYHLLYKPTKKDFYLYWQRDCIVITDLISEAPLSLTQPHRITIEKILVDIWCDKLISGTYSAGEYPDVLAQAFAKYQIDRPRLLRYARRRNKENEILRILDNHS